MSAGVNRSNNESIERLWVSEGRSIFGAFMSLKVFKKISRVIRFDRQTRNERRLLDKAPIRVFWNQWVVILSTI